MDSVWREAAQKLLDTVGYHKARQQTIRARNENSPGTASFAFHNAVLKQLEAIVDEELRYALKQAEKEGEFRE